MKKYLILIPCLILLCGCSLYNSPKKQTELFLAKYQTLSDEVLNNLDITSFQENSLNMSQKDEYIEIMKRQYKDMVYEIKDELIDGNTAVVTAEIDVYDYAKSITDSYNNKNVENTDIVYDGSINETLFMDYLLNNMKKTKDRIKFTINFNLVKRNKNWFVTNLSYDDLQKISGIYSN